jgi:two-component system response regulator HupR/HoxA
MFRKKKNVVEMRTVLFVDDDEAILRSLERGLIDEPYNTLFTNSCKEALEILQREEVHVIVTDMRMPEMSGLEFIKIIKKEYPHIIRMVLSGYDNDATLQTAVDKGEIFKLIPKPWKLGGNLEKFVQRAVDQYNLQNKSSPCQAAK